MSITLSSDRLVVEIALPGQEPNTTHRFDRAGFITQVTLDGRYQFCTREPDNLSHPCSGGIGLCSEYQMDTASKEAQIGAKFIKPGIGLLTKTEPNDYIFHKQYEVEPFPVSWEQCGNTINFTTEPIPCQGYALRLTKQIIVDGSTLKMTMKVSNVGEREIDLTEYCHNFITIDRLPIGPGYRLELYKIAVQDGKLTPENNGTFTGSGSGFSFTGYNPQAAMVHVQPEDILPNAPFYWELSNTGSPARIRETDSFTPDEVAVWSIDHIISPEVFHHITLQPSESSAWTRTWSFTASF
ncbi:MAG: hypothetical protein ACYCZF_02040 [Anaerolineae bacterium]